MSKLRCIVIEDEPLAMKVVVDYISLVPFLELKDTFKSALTAIKFLRGHPVDLIFLDIHLPQLKGMDFLRSLPNPPAVIITTAYHQYAVEGFDLNVTDYLLKPFGFDRFLTAVNKVKSTDDSFADKDFIFVNVQKKKVKILFSEIAYIESQREYIKIVTTSREFVTKMPTHEIEKLLPGNLFKRIHRSFIISVDKIDAYTAESVQVRGVWVPVGRDYRGVVEDL